MAECPAGADRRRREHADRDERATHGRAGAHPVFASVAGLIALAALAGGIGLLVSGHLSGLVPAVLRH